MTNKTERRFLKVVMLDINRKIDISKNFKLFDNSFSNISWIVVLFVFIIVLLVSLMSFFNSLLEQFIIFMVNYFLGKNTVINLKKIIFCEPMFKRSFVVRYQWAIHIALFKWIILKRLM